MGRNYGKTAVVRYKGTFADGTVFDSTDGIEPLEFKIGSGRVIHGFDEAVSSMSAGEHVKITIPAGDAFGEYDKSKVDHAPMYAIPGAKDIKIGELFYFVTEEGMRMPARVTEINKGIATVDFNNPLAGHDLNFEIDLLELR